MKTSIREKIRQGIVYFDGGMGTLLQSMGLAPGEHPECWNLTCPDNIVAVHRSYLQAGCHILTTNTFGANGLKFEDEGEFSLERIITAAVGHAKEAIRLEGMDTQDRYVALDVGPLGKLLKPLGDLDFEDAVRLFARVASIGSAAGADLVLVETMNDSYETKAAVLAVKENCALPVFVTNTYDQNGKLMTGASPAAMVALLEGLGVDALGINCGLGPKEIKRFFHKMARYASVPLVMTPNAGLPRSENGRTVFDVGPDEFASMMAKLIPMGARILGGCCGTTPEHIKKLVERTKDMTLVPLEEKGHTLVSSYAHAVVIGEVPILIGERINPTGKSRFKQAIRENDVDYILQEGIRQQENGAHILDVNVGLPEIDEAAVIQTVVQELQGVTDLPLQIDTASPEAMERAMRVYNGKPMLNSVNGKAESMKAVLPLMKKYGGVVVALTLDETGIPDTAEGRLEIAKKIYAEAETYGIRPKDIVVDTLTMTVSSDNEAAKTTLETLALVKKELGAKTSLGVSNVSFGLPNRDFINGTFFAMALQRGLDAAIMNPNSQEMMKTYWSFLTLSGQDPQCAGYIEYASGREVESAVAPASAAVADSDLADPLIYAIVKGLKQQAVTVTKRLLEQVPPLELVNSQIVPALDRMGRGFEEKRVYLPQLMMSAETAKASFEVIKEAMHKEGVASKRDGKIVIATVYGDIHDIGKNIVRTLLENYNFDVLDLGKDVPPETVVDAALKHNAKLVGLSALMTTTVPAMASTIKLLREKMPGCPVMVGGAVLTQEYADMIGADKYTRDAMGAVRYAEQIIQ